MANFSKVRGLKERYPNAISYFQGTELDYYGELLSTGYVDLCLENGDWVTKTFSLNELLDKVQDHFVVDGSTYVGCLTSLRRMFEEKYLDCKEGVDDVLFLATEKLMGYCEKNSPQKSFDSDGKGF